MKISQKISLFACVALATFSVDLLTKKIATEKLIEGVTGIDFTPFFSLQISYNPAIAFGIPVSLSIVIPLSVAIILGIFWIFFRQTRDTALAAIAFGLLIGGAVGNLFERIFRGEVIDFIRFWLIPNFNFADAAITVAVLLLVVFYPKIFSTK